MSTRQSSTRAPARRESRSAALPPPRRRFGQNFLVDASAIERIVAALAPAPEETVVEIGPGRGALTEALLRRVPRVTAIEIDRDLAAMLRARHDPARLALVEADALGVDLGAIAPRCVVVGNLPYNVSKPMAMKLVAERAAVARAVLMFQREVALRLVARPGTSAYGPLTVLAGEAYAIETLFDLRPGAFRPRPEVLSSVTRWTPREGQGLPADLEGPLRAVLRLGFARRRQTLLRNLREGLPGGEAAARALLEEASIDGALRAEALSPEAFVRLARVWPAGAA